LLAIPGVGPTKRRALLHTFGSLQGVKAASVEDIAAVPGFGRASAERILRSLGVDVPDPASPEEPAVPDVAVPDVAVSDVAVSDVAVSDVAVSDVAESEAPTPSPDLPPS
jgi:hypothetical protein